MHRLTIAAIAIATAITTTGCQQYFARQDLIESYSGDAVARNLALQTPDPWPHGVYDTDISTNGRRQADAYQAYAKQHEDTPADAVEPVQLVVPQ
jgi:hypothetical protein